MSDTHLQTFKPNFSYFQFICRNFGISWGKGGSMIIGAIIFLPFGILSGNWIIVLLCLAFLSLDYYGYYLTTKESIDISANKLTHTTFNLLNQKQVTTIPINEIIHAELNKIFGPFTFFYTMEILRGLDKDEPLLFRKRTEQMHFANWSDDVVLQIEKAIIKLLPRKTSIT